MILFFSGTGNSEYVAKNIGFLNDDEVIDIIKHYVEKHPRMPAAVIYDELISNHYITYKDLSL